MEIIFSQEFKNEFKFIVLKSHKESFALAEELAAGQNLSLMGIPKFRMIICTKLKVLDKEVDGSMQRKLV